MTDSRPYLGSEAWLLLPQTIFNGIVIILVATGIVAMVAQAGGIGRIDQQLTDIERRLTEITGRIDAEVLLGRAAIERQQTNIADIRNLIARVGALESRIAEQDAYERHLEDRLTDLNNVVHQDGR